MKEKFIKFVIIALTAIFSASMVHAESLYPTIKDDMEVGLMFDSTSNMLVYVQQFDEVVVEEVGESDDTTVAFTCQQQI